MNILITGTSKGIGRYLAEYYVKLGHNVFGCSRNPNDLNFMIMQTPHWKHYQIDITEQQEVIAMIADIKRLYGKLDVLINNAGIASMNHSLLTPIETFKKTYETNVFGAFLLMQESAKLMLKNKFGRIVNFSTVAVPLSLEGEASYASSKSALETLTKIMSKDLGIYGITVNAISPTVVNTDLVKNVPQSKLDKIRACQAIKRDTEFSDITNVMDFFIKPESDFITGQIIKLGGI